MREQSCSRTRYGLSHFLPCLHRHLSILSVPHLIIDTPYAFLQGAPLAQIRSAAPPRQEELYVPLGHALLAFNSRFGVPKDIWTAIQSAVITCESCCYARTIHAHERHLDPTTRLCSHEGRHGGFLIVGPHTAKVRQMDGTFASAPIVVDDDED